MKGQTRHIILGMGLALLLSACGSTPQQERIDVPQGGTLSGPVVEQR
ncbi:MAG TPA: META domain-containing protein, partial [Halomonas sp.]|nr:META domain-containing protein [Halomonas sp.]